MKVKLCTGITALGVSSFLLLICKQNNYVKKKTFAVVYDVFKCLFEQWMHHQTNWTLTIKQDELPLWVSLLLQPMTMTTDVVKLKEYFSNGRLKENIYMKIQPYVDSWVSETQADSSDPARVLLWCLFLSPLPHVCLKISTLLPK